MRYRVAVLMLSVLFIVLPVMSLPAAPAPERAYAILDIGPPPKGKTAKEYCKSEMERLTCHVFFLTAFSIDAEMRKLPSITCRKDWRVFCPWIAKNLQLKQEKGSRHLRLTFQADSRAEQTTLLNALLRAYIQLQNETQELHERCLRNIEEGTPRLAKKLKEEKNPQKLRQYQKQWEDGEVAEKEYRFEIARGKRVAVLRWAK